MRLNYTDWKNEYAPVLATFANKKVFMLFTGGKDSSVILSFLLRAAREFGFEFETHCARFPARVFPDAETEKLDTYWRSRSVDIRWHAVNASEDMLEEAEKDGKNPCHVCHKIKRIHLFGYLHELGQNTEHMVIILSFSLWDLVSYSLEYLVNGVFSTAHSESHEERFIRTSQRFYPLIELKDGFTVFKPLLKYNDHEILDVVKEEKIPLSTIECPYKRYTPKRILFEYYAQANASFDYERVLHYVKDSFKLNDLSQYAEMGTYDFIKDMV